MIAAGLDGLSTHADPGPHSDLDMYAEGHLAKDAIRLPLNLLDALREYDKDTLLDEAMGAEFSTTYLKLKNAEWNAYATHFSEWERANTLDIYSLAPELGSR